MNLSTIKGLLNRPWTLGGQLNYAPTRRQALEKVLAMKRISDAHAFAILGGDFSLASKERVIANIIANNDFTSRRSESFDGRHYSSFHYPWDTHLPFLFRWLRDQPQGLVSDICDLWRQYKARTEPDEYRVFGETRFELERAFTTDPEPGEKTTLMCRQYHSPARRMFLGYADPDRPGFKHDLPYAHETIIHGCYVQGRPFYF